jgi:tetrahydromethanopterin S-methyltransferase subunit D
MHAEMAQLTAVATGTATASLTALAMLAGFVVAEWMDYRRRVNR